jgi:hypothetical protein
MNLAVYTKFVIGSAFAGCNRRFFASAGTDIVHGSFVKEWGSFQLYTILCDSFSWKAWNFKY